MPSGEASRSLSNCTGCSSVWKTVHPIANPGSVLAVVEAQRLRVFISWSGEVAKEIAKDLRWLLPHLFDLVEPWMSDRDIAPGSRGLETVGRTLDETGFGLIVTTRANQHAPWLNYEAGALSKRFEEESEPPVIPILVDLDGPAELDGPLAQFQAKRLSERAEMEDVVSHIADALGVDPQVAITRLNYVWDEFEQRVTGAVESHSSLTAGADLVEKRDTDDMIEETLEIVRGLAAMADRRSAAHPNDELGLLATPARATSRSRPGVRVKGLDGKAKEVALAMDPVMTKYGLYLKSVKRFGKELSVESIRSDTRQPFPDASIYDDLAVALRDVLPEAKNIVLRVDVSTIPKP